MCHDFEQIKLGQKEGKKGMSTTTENSPPYLDGVSLFNVSLTVMLQGKRKEESFLFTGQGILL